MLSTTWLPLGCTGSVPLKKSQAMPPREGRHTALKKSIAVYYQGIQRSNCGSLHHLTNFWRMQLLLNFWNQWTSQTSSIEGDEEAWELTYDLPPGSWILWLLICWSSQLWGMNLKNLAKSLPNSSNQNYAGPTANKWSTTWLKRHQ